MRGLCCILQKCSLCPLKDAADTSSAYNTGGDSCRSASVTPDGPPNGTRLRQTRNLHANVTITPGSSVTTIVPVYATPLNNADFPSGVSTLQRSPRLRRTSKLNGDAADRNPTSSGYESSRVPTNSPPQMRSPAHQPSNGLCSPSNGSPQVPPHLANPNVANEYSNRFRVPSFSITLRSKSNMHPATPAVMPQPKPNFSPLANFKMPKFFRSLKPQPTLYMFDKPVDQLKGQLETEDDELPTTSGTVIDLHDAGNDTMKYKWKVRRRGDGSRYVVKRPIRSQILKKREAQLNKERTGVSTDDTDAHSDLKIGHFHRREDRKKHLERERERKHRNEQKKILSRAATPADQAIVQLSQQKMERQKERMVLDRFVTTQEVLAQRHIQSEVINGVSITTV